MPGIRLFVPRPRGRSYAEFNAWLLDACIRDARRRVQPTIPDKTVWHIFEEEQPFLMAYRGPFYGFHATEAAVSKTCLVRFYKNQYSVAARAIGRPVDVRALRREDRHPPERRDRRRTSPELCARLGRL